MNYLRFTSFLNRISVISGRWEGDKERLCAMKPPFVYPEALNTTYKGGGGVNKAHFVTQPNLLITSHN